MAENINEKLLSGSSKIDSTSARLDLAYKTAQETEHISIQVLDNLRQQREQLQRASEALHDTDTSMSQSNRLLRTMMRRYKISIDTTTTL